MKSEIRWLSRHYVDGRWAGGDPHPKRARLDRQIYLPCVGPLSDLPCGSALLDGEIAVADDKGHTNFGALQNALSEERGGFGYYLFDLLHLDGDDLRNRRADRAQGDARKLLAGVGKNGPLYYSDHVEGQGQTVFEQACKLQLEGIIAKQADSRYVSGRSQSWLKIKCGMEQEFIIVGWRESDKAGRPFSSILLAVREGDELRYCGRVGSGLYGRPARRPREEIQATRPQGAGG